MKDIKNCFKLFKYGYQMKTNILCAVLFFLLGIGFCAVSHDQFVICIVYFFLSILFVAQPMHMMLFSEFVGASPKRKKVELRYIDIINVVGGILAAVISIIAAFLSESQSSESVSVETNLIIGGWVAIILYCYMSLSFKTMIVGTILFFVSFFSVMYIAGGAFVVMFDDIFAGKTVLAVVIFLVEVAIGIVLGHGVRRLLYRRSMSKWAMGAMLRMEQS